MQPLHVGFTGDLGGNKIIVRWYRRKTNLHHVSVVAFGIFSTFSNFHKLKMKEADCVLVDAG